MLSLALYLALELTDEGTLVLAGIVALLWLAGHVIDPDDD
jgi:hypothetical protein